MAEYIERDKAVQVAIGACVGVCKDITDHGITHIHGVEIAEKIEKIPAADVVEVVRCKECAFRGDMFDCECWHSPLGEAGLFTDDDFYCSCGERKCEDG